jgi:hypothetical protein
MRAALVALLLPTAIGACEVTPNDAEGARKPEAAAPDESGAATDTAPDAPTDAANGASTDTAADAATDAALDAPMGATPSASMEAAPSASKDAANSESSEDSPRQLPFGATCSANDDCATTVCFTFGNGTAHCTQTCTNDTLCPTGSQGSKCNGKGYCAF